MNECLKIKLDRINNRLKQTSNEEHNEIKSCIYSHIMWIENCWACLHCLYPLYKYIYIYTSSNDNLILEN